MPKASDLKKGSIVELGGDIYVVRQLEAKSPSSRGAATLYKVRFAHVRSKQKRDESFKGDDMLPDVAFAKRAVQFSYQDGNFYHFMDSEDYSQYSLSADDLEGQLPYLSEGLEGLAALLVEDQVIGLELPQSVDLAIVDTAPAIKGASAAARTKPAILVSGLEVQVPEYLAVGEVIRVNTTTGKFMSRA